MTENDLVPDVGHLCIADQDFVIATATIAEFTDSSEQRRWNVEIATVKRRMDFPEIGHDEYWEPNIYGSSVRVDAPPFESIIGRTILVPEAYDSLHDDYLFSICVHEHAEVSSSRIQFVERCGDKLRIEWRGRCNLHWNEQYGENIPFALLADFQVSSA